MTEYYSATAAIDVVSDDESSRKDGLEKSDLRSLGGLADGYDKSIRPALDAVDEIRPYLKNIPEVSRMLPAIVVVGEQSSGKSSLLVSISGIELPRGNGMCTKVPLELQLRSCKTSETITMEYTDSQGNNVQISDIAFTDIARNIEQATVAIVGAGKTVKDQPITLRICGPSMIDLTLIDLPGITRAANATDSANVEQETSALIKKYVESESRLIVCALPANVDFSNSGALKIAQEVDPEGKRTIGVVTKIDTYEKGTGIKERLEGTHSSEIKLALGYVAVRSRTNLELQKGMSLEELQAIEEDFLSTDPELQYVSQERKGTNSLIETLITIQRDRLRAKIPELTKKIEDNIVDREKSLKALQSVPESPEANFLDLAKSIDSISKKFKDISSIDGCEEKELDIRYHLLATIAAFKREIDEVSSNVYNNEIFKQVKSLCERRQLPVLPDFLSISVFRDIFNKEFLEKYDSPTTVVLRDAHQTALSVLHKVVSRNVQSNIVTAIPALQEMVAEYIAAVTENIEAAAPEDVSMQLEVWTPVPQSFDETRMRFKEYELEFSRYLKNPPMDKSGNVLPFQFSGRVLSCCNSDEELFIQELTQEAEHDPLTQHCLSLMHSLAAYITGVRDGILGSLSKKILRQYITKPCENHPGSLSAFLLDKCSTQKEELFYLTYDPALIDKRKRLTKEIKELQASKQALMRSILKLCSS